MHKCAPYIIPFNSSSVKWLFFNAQRLSPGKFALCSGNQPVPGFPFFAQQDQQFTVTIQKLQLQFADGYGSVPSHDIPEIHRRFANH